MTERLIDKVIDDALKDDEKEEKKEALTEEGMVRITRQAKMARLGGGLAVGMAKKANDPMYAKMIKAKKMFKSFKKKIMQKYGMKGKTAARKAVM